MHSGATLHWTIAALLSMLLVEWMECGTPADKKARATTVHCSAAARGRQAERARFEAISGWVEAARFIIPFNEVVQRLEQQRATLVRQATLPGSLLVVCKHKSKQH